MLKYHAQMLRFCAAPNAGSKAEMFIHEAETFIHEAVQNLTMRLTYTELRITAGQ